jgi:hypothetical protein
MSANGGDPLDFSCSLFFLFCVGNQAGTTRKFQTWFKTTHRLDGWMRPLKFWKFLERLEQEAGNAAQRQSSDLRPGKTENE